MSKSSTATKAPQAAAMQPKAAAPAQPKPAAPAQPGLPMDKVAMRAYQKWLLGGCKHGNDQKDWLEAEAEIKAEIMKSGAAKAGR